MAKSKQLSNEMKVQTEILFKEGSLERQIAKKMKISR